MISPDRSDGTTGRVLALSADLSRADTADAAVTRATELLETVFDQPAVGVFECGTDAGVVRTLGSVTSASTQAQAVGTPDRIPDPVLDRLAERGDAPSAGDTPEVTVETDPPGPRQTAAFAPVGRKWLLRVGVTDPGKLDDSGVATVEGVAANLETALARVGQQQSATPDAAQSDAAALRRLNELTVDPASFDRTVERLLSLGCAHFGLDTGILARIEEGDYEVEAVVDATGTHEPGAVYDLGETMCQATVAGEAPESLAFADIADTDHERHPAAENVRAYIAAPVVVDGATYGTVNFSMGSPRSEPVRPGEEEFVKLVAQWVGTAVERRRRFAELERYETILEAVDDPVYALDTEGRFTFVNEAAKREFGYGTEVIGEHPSVAMADADVERIREQVEGLIATDERSTTAEFELETADGGRTVVENRLGLIGDGEFRGTAGVLRDVTERRARERELESFRQAVESARDGVAVLDDETYTYIDQSHVDMYGFESKAQLLGNSWRELYDEREVERLEAEAFPALESEGYWRGMVTGSRPDGTTFPAELSLTLIEDGRLVCTVRDETERRARERDLELKERAMDEATVSIQITDPSQPENPLVYVNDGFERLTGYTREEALGRNPWFLQGEETDPEKVTQLREAVAAEEPVSLELRNERKDGTRYWAHLSLTPVTDESGAVQHYIGIQQDVTERKARERQTEKTVEVLERVYEVTTDPALSFEEKVDGLLAAGNEYLDLPSAFLTQIEPGDDHTAGTQTIVRAQGTHDGLQPGESCPLPQSYCRQTIEDSGLTTITEAAAEGWAGDPAHETFGLETYIAGAVDAGGDTYGTLCFASREPRTTGFTETEQSFVNLLRRWVGYELDRRTTREELRAERERLELTLSGTDTGLAEWDIRTGAVEWNDTLTELLGLDVDSRAAFEAAVHPDDRDRVRTELRTAVETGDPWVSELRVTDGDGAVRWVGTRGVPTYDDEGEPVRLLATATDITDRKQAEREREENERRYRSLAENIPNGAVLSFDAALEYRLAAGELLSEFGLEPADISGQAVGTLFPGADAGDELVPRFRAALEGERTDCRVELGDRTLRVHIVPVDDGDDEGTAEDRGLVLAQDVTEGARRERELSEERERFRLLTESVEEYAFLVVGEDGTVQTWNESAETMFGYDAETALGMPMAELHPEADRESGLPGRLLQQARVAGESGHEGWRVRADGSRFYADVRYAPLEADDGTFRGYATVVRDMTDQRRQQRRTERFVEESDDVVTIVDTDGTVTYASGSASRVLGHDSDNLVGENLFDYIHPEGREDAMRTFFASARDPDAEAHAECRLRSGDGEWLNVEGQCRNMLEDDAIDGMLLYLRDVTEQKERARRFESIFNQTFQFTGLLEPDGTVLEVNDAVLEFGGIERDAIVGSPFFEASWWTHSADVQTDVRNAIERAASAEFVRYETEVRGGAGLATIDFSVKPVTDDDGEVSLLVAEGRDITARQRQSQHLEVMQRVIRHNMRNDLTKVRGWAQVMCEETDPDKRAEQFETLEGTLDKWESMTDRMSELRQILHLQQEQQPRMEAGSLVDDAVTPLRAEYTDATILTDVSGDGVAVPATLIDAVRELVTNAAEATDDATIEVDLSSPEGDWVEVWVSDDGPGLPEMEADVLETGEETPLNHGQGLGLWMVRMVVVQAGGEVSVESSADGTEVCLRLPTRRTPETATPASTER